MCLNVLFALAHVHLATSKCQSVVAKSVGSVESREWMLSREPELQQWFQLSHCLFRPVDLSSLVFFVTQR